MKRIFAVLPLVTVVFWNVQNFFDWRTAEVRYASKSAFYSKCSKVARTLMLISEQEGECPDIAAFAEIGDRYVLESLLGTTCLRKLGYGIVHYDSPDPRGIDCGLIYRRKALKLLDSAPCHIYDSTGAMIPTRDILMAKFASAAGDTLAVLVNHHPSKLREGAAARRAAARNRMHFLADSLLAAGCRCVLAVGDFNDTVPGDQPSYKYAGRWDKIDGSFLYGDASARESTFAHPLLTVPDKTYGGVKPSRDISDHYPIVVHLSFEK